MSSKPVRLSGYIHDRETMSPNDSTLDGASEADEDNDNDNEEKGSDKNSRFSSHDNNNDTNNNNQCRRVSGTTIYTKEHLCQFLANIDNKDTVEAAKELFKKEGYFRKQRRFTKYAPYYFLQEKLDELGIYIYDEEIVMCILLFRFVYILLTSIVMYLFTFRHSALPFFALYFLSPPLYIPLPHSA